MSAEPLCSSGRQPPVAVAGLTQNATLKSALLTPSALSVAGGWCNHIFAVGREVRAEIIGRGSPQRGPAGVGAIVRVAGGIGGRGAGGFIESEPRR